MATLSQIGQANKLPEGTKFPDIENAQNTFNQKVAGFGSEEAFKQQAPTLYGNLQKTISYYSPGGPGYQSRLRDFNLREAEKVAPSLGITAAQLVTNPELQNDPEALKKFTNVDPNAQPAGPAHGFAQQEGKSLGAVSTDGMSELERILTERGEGTPNEIPVPEGFKPTFDAQGVPVQPSETDLKRFQQGFNDAQAAGIDSPDTIGGAADVIGKFLPATQQPDNISGFLQADPFLNNVIATFQEMMSEANTRTSLVDEYDALLKSSGIEAINTELLDMKNIIEGTEDDIRTEVTKAGGFATESQILALTNARNKQLIKNYNTLLETRASKERYLDTMLNLTIADRQEASQRFDKMLNFGFKLSEMYQNMQSRATEAYNNIVNRVGYLGLLNMVGEDAYSTSLVERGLGLSPGGLQALAQQEALFLSQDQEEKELGLASQRLELASQQLGLEGQLLGLEGKELDIALKQRELSQPIGAGSAFTLSPGQIRYDAQGNVIASGGEAPEKPLTATQSLALGYGTRMQQANNIFGGLLEGGFFPSKIQRNLPNFFKSSEQQQFEQAERNFINANLRRESGAVISPSEFADARQQYLPQPGDKEEVLAQKAANRKLVIQNMLREAGQGGEPDIESFRSQLNPGEVLVREVSTGNIMAINLPEFVPGKYETL